MEPRIVFMGTPEFAIPSLERLLAHYDVVGIVTQPDSPAGRGQRLVAPPVKEMALAEGIPVYQPKSLRTSRIVNTITGVGTRFAVVAAFGQILRQTCVGNTQVWNTQCPRITAAQMARGIPHSGCDPCRGYSNRHYHHEN